MSPLRGTSSQPITERHLTALVQVANPHNAAVTLKPGYPVGLFTQPDVMPGAGIGELSEICITNRDPRFANLVSASTPTPEEVEEGTVPGQDFSAKWLWGSQ